MAGLNIKNEQKLQNTLADVKKYCPGAVPQLDKVDFIFAKEPINGKGYTERNGEKYKVTLPYDFYKAPPDERLNTACHEVEGHVCFMEQNRTVKGNSKTEERFAYPKGEAAKEKFLKDRGKTDKPFSIEEKINKDSAYRCLPEKPVTSASEMLKEGVNTLACQIKNGIKDYWSMGISKPRDQR